MPNANTRKSMGHCQFIAEPPAVRIVVVTISSELFCIEHEPAGIWQDAVIAGVELKLLNVIWAMTVLPLEAEREGGKAVTVGPIPLP